MRNRELQNTLREKDPDHWARLFGEHVEVAYSAGPAPPPVPQQELVQKACEAVVQAAIPAIERVLGTISQQLAEALNAQADAQRTMLDQLLEASRRQGPGRPLVTINTAPRRNSDLERINIEAPQNQEEEARLRGNALPVSKFLKDVWQPAWRKAGVKPSGCLTQFSVLLQARIFFLPVQNYHLRIYC